MGSDLKGRIAVFVAMVVVTLAFLAPTIFRDSMPETWISKPLSLGLDLSGGVHLVYEVQTKEAVKSRLQSEANAMRFTLRQEKIAVVRHRVTDDQRIEITLLSDDAAEKARSRIEQDFRTISFVEKQSDGGRTKLIYGISSAQAQRIETDSVTQAVETLRNRVDQFGVAEPLIQKVGVSRIMLQMPGMSDIEAVKRVVGKVAKLEFKLVPEGGASSDTETLKDRDGTPITVESQALMTGDAVDKANVDLLDGQVEVALQLTSDGAKTFRRITAENVGRRLAIVLDGIVYSDPVIREAIGGGRASISGGFSLEEARQLAVVLRAGALPAPLHTVEERTVGPTLGQESITKSVIATIVCFISIGAFMVLYYKKSGAMALATLVLNLFFMLGILSAFGATLTLPGIVGLALTVGMAVDANVIIFERIRDEVRNGASRDAAVMAGFDKAYTAILDANITTLIIAMILYYFGSGPIRGFAVTLSIGIVTTMITAIFVARLAFDYFPLRGKQGLSI